MLPEFTIMIDEVKHFINHKTRVVAYKKPPNVLTGLWKFENEFSTNFQLNLFIKYLVKEADLFSRYSVHPKNSFWYVQVFLSFPLLFTLLN